MAAEKGNLFILSAPSGAGKTTLCRAILDRYPDMLYSISHTTRKPRPGERPGVDYHFIGKDEFLLGVRTGKWAEWAEVHGNYYGTDADFLGRGIASGRDVLLDIDTQGMRQSRTRYPDAVTIFILPPSVAALKARLEGRGTDSRDVIERRLEKATQEMGSRHLYRYVIVNDRLEEAVSRLAELVETYRCGG
jgi:guanylate kinase